MAKKRIDLGYECRKQFQAFHQRKQRWACIVAHRRAGKSVACVMDLIDHALRCRKPDGRFSYISPTYSQSKEIAWSYLKRFTAEIPGIEQRESDLMVRFPNGARVRLYGADNFDRLRGGYNDGLIMDEFGDIDPRAWPEVLRPSLADRNGWAVFIGTPKGRNEFYRVYEASRENPDWFSMMLKADESGLLPQAELDDMRLAMTPDQYLQELLCSFDAAIRGAIYRTELAAMDADGRICAVPYDPAVPVWTAWDLGIGDASAIFCAQLVGKEVHIIDYYEATGEALTHYVAWLDSKPYRYGTDLLPHDAAARELGTGKTREEMLRANGRKVRIVPRQDVDDGINATKMLMARMWMDKERTARGRECLAHYRRDFNDRMGIYKDSPVHDWSSHCFEGETNVLTRSGISRIMDLPETGEVLTPCGWRRYQSPRVTAKNAPLVEVAFSDGYTVKCTPDHLFLTDNGWTSARSLRMGSLIQSTLTPSRSTFSAVSTVFGRVKSIYQKPARLCIEMFGARLLGPFLPDVISTMLTGIPSTTSLSIWSVSQPKSTSPLRGGLVKRRNLQRMNISPIWQGPGRLNGTHRLKAGFGIADMPNVQNRGQNGSVNRGIVDSAAGSLIASSGVVGISRSTARCSANTRHIGRAIKLFQGSVRLVIRNLALFPGQAFSRSIAASNARTTPIAEASRWSGSVVSTVTRIWKSGSIRMQNRGDGAVESAGMLVVSSVLNLPYRADVWDITVPGVECFSLANGAVVHNSADAMRTLSMGLREATPQRLPSTVTPIRLGNAGNAAWMGA